jgi:SecD/SecF fusion protein
MVLAAAITAIVLLVEGSGSAGDAGGCTNESTFSGPATKVTYRAYGAGAPELARTMDILCVRLQAMEVRHRVRRSAARDVTIEVPRQPSPSLEIDDVTRTGRLSLYDWEANVVGPDGSVGSQDPTVTGGLAAGGLGGAIELYVAVQRAKGVEPEIDGNSTHEGLFYLVNTKDQTVLNGPANSRASMFDGLQYTEQQLPADIELIEVPPGVVILRAQGPENVDPDEIERYYVLRDDPAVGGADIENPEPDRDSSSGGGEPIVTFEFTDEGRPRWEAMTREITRRGLANIQPGVPPDSSNQHVTVQVEGPGCAA